MANDFVVVCESGEVGPDIWNSASGEVGLVTASNGVLGCKTAGADFVRDIDRCEGANESSERAKRLTVKPVCDGVRQAGNCSDLTFEDMVGLYLDCIVTNPTVCDLRLVFGIIVQMFTGVLTRGISRFLPRTEVFRG